MLELAVLALILFRALIFDGAALRRAVALLYCSTTHVCRRSLGRLLSLVGARAGVLVLKRHKVSEPRNSIITLGRDWAPQLLSFVCIQR